MKPKVRLFDGRVTFAQRLIVLVWGLVLLSIVALWVTGSSQLIGTSLSGTLLAIGRLLGLLATFFALTQFMLMGRVAWIERQFGLDRLAGYHRLNGYLAIMLIVLHPIFIVGSYAVQTGRNYIVEYFDTIQRIPYVWLALIAEILFVMVVLSSIYIARKRMPFEAWYFVHLLVYAAIVIVPFHQFVIAPELAGSEFGRWYWLGLYGFVAFNVLAWRFGAIGYNFMKYDFKVSRVVMETPTVTSVYIKAAKGNGMLTVKPGQFVLIRILNRAFWWQEHPFSVSWVPQGNELRLTIRNVGTYTRKIANLKPGARVFISGPYGRLTSDVMTTKKQLLIAGGIGITPLRSLSEQAAKEGTNAVVVYANRDASDVPLKKEMDKIGASPNVAVRYVFSDEKPAKGRLIGRVDGDMIRHLVSDFKSRDIYLCGPPAMMAALVRDLHALGVPAEQIHLERFALHN
jgi:predicted ferric reductase